MFTFHFLALPDEHSVNEACRKSFRELVYQCIATFRMCFLHKGGCLYHLPDASALKTAVLYSFDWLVKTA